MKFHKDFIEKVGFEPNDFGIEAEYQDDFLYLTKEEYLLAKLMGFDLLNIESSLYLSVTNITELPDNLSVGGNLGLRHTNITELPDNLSVGGYLSIRDTKITELPDNLTIGGDIFCDEDQLKYIPEKFKDKMTRMTKYY